MSNDMILEARGIKKAYTGVQVLKGVDFLIRKGEIHSLVGENGAGKSTLIKILTGAVTKDEGTIEFNGNRAEIRDRSDSIKLGISVIFQDLSLIPTLTVAENIFLGKEPVHPATKLIRRKELNRKAEELIRQYGFSLSANMVVERLSIAQQQLVEILKALSLESSLLIMDEPTASLTAHEAQQLFKVVRDLRNRGVSILYISHRMDEVYDLSDQITILRNGECIRSVPKDEINPSEIINLMIGKVIEHHSRGRMFKDFSHTEPCLQVSGLTRRGAFTDINFQVYPGEVVGLAGLVGAGRTEILRAIFGIDKLDEGSISLQSERVKKPSVKKSIRLGIGFIPEERRAQGLVSSLSINRNISLSNHDQIKRFKVLVNKRLESKMAQNSIVNLDIRPSNPDMLVQSLSGGNQQKVVLAKWLARDLKVLLIDEPTAGVDVGAKEEIYKIIEQLSAKGVSIVLVSSDMAELIRLSNRVLVLRSGKVVTELMGGSSEEDILAAASGIVKTEVVS
jgi:ribose transport system ATP-binding protein